MKKTALVLMFSVLVVWQVGCDSTASLLREGFKKDAAKMQYHPAVIEILPLTALKIDSDEETIGLKVYVSLGDSFGSQIKSAGLFRFELYEYLLRSAEPKGKRLFIWGDIDLTDAKINNDHWRDVLRSYEFSLDADVSGGGRGKYVLQVTFIADDGSRRLDDTVVVDSGK